MDLTAPRQSFIELRGWGRVTPNPLVRYFNNNFRKTLKRITSALKETPFGWAYKMFLRFATLTAYRRVLTL